jgi:hypothetical protein
MAAAPLVVSRESASEPQDISLTTSTPPLDATEVRERSLLTALKASIAAISSLVSVPFTAVKDAFTGGVRHSHFEHRISLSDEERADDVLQMAKRKLKNPNRWESFGPGIGAARFQLYDGEKAEPKGGPPLKGDHLKIRLPDGMSPSWVEIESIEKTNKSAEMVVRPSADPRKPEEPTTRHLFSRQTTNVFRVEKQGTDVVVSVAGRHEKANDEGSIWDRKLAAARTAGAWMGAKNPQWHSFTRKLLSRAEEKSRLAES